MLECSYLDIYSLHRGNILCSAANRRGAPDFGDPNILGARTISSISVSNYICIFVLVQLNVFFTVLLIEDIC